MSEGYLSQDEIDALLQGTESIGDASQFSSTQPLSENEKAAFKNMIQATVESQSSNLSMITGKSVILGAPNVEIRSKQQFIGELANELVETKVDFTEGVSGEHSYLLQTDFSTRLASFIMGQEKVDLNEAALSGLAEALSNLAGSTATAIGNQINTTVMISPAECRKILKNKVRFPEGDNFVKVEYPISIEGEKPSTLMEIYALGTVKQITAKKAGDGMAAVAKSGQGRSRESQMPNIQDFSQVNMGNMFSQPEDSGGGFISTPNVQSVQFPNLQSGPSAHEQGNIGLLMDVFMEMTVELGRTRKLIKEILGIGEGTIIELDKLAGEPVDILVNHKLIAKGEVVVIDENFGVRVTEIVSPMDRMADLK
ncbi:MAG: flagellar motor switch phosphatase FliY [Spirochaetaceae bacterium]|nr:MAG: flagellar motor switch phosphatase FliY [Spirochaetaceae bacterium]